MKQSIKSKIIRLPKAIIFGLALLNFFYVISHTVSTSISQGGKLSFPAYNAWYDTSEIVVVWILLATSICLLITSRTSYFIAAFFSGYFTVIGCIHIFLRELTLLERWQGILKFESNIFLAYEVQWVLAAIVFSTTIFYLVREFTRENLQ